MADWLEANAYPAVMIALPALGVAVLMLILLIILWLRARRASRRDRTDRVSVQRDAVELELRLREQLARLRMVRELHEVAVHSVSVIVSQADGARYAGATDPSAAVRSAGAIADSARSTIADLRRVMAVVREGEASAMPQPRLRSARDLFTVMRDAGLVITFNENGKPFDLQAGAELAIYRILQESLSNALKFGGEGTEVTVSFTWRDESFQLLVDDDGVRAQARRDGLDPNEVSRGRAYSVDDDLAALTEVITGPGITEMRERAALFGGTVNAYSVPGVGFSLAAVFPALLYNNGIDGVNLGS
ncbi:MAG: histidine kinase [Terrimesophilobacter sp.]